MSSKPGPKDEATPKWKFAIIVWLGIFPGVLAINYLMAPFWKDWAIWQKILLVSLIEVPYAVFFAIPTLQNIFKDWLKDGQWSQS